MLAASQNSFLAAQDIGDSTVTEWALDLDVYMKNASRWTIPDSRLTAAQS